MRGREAGIKGNLVQGISACSWVPGIPSSGPPFGDAFFFRFRHASLNKSVAFGGSAEHLIVIVALVPLMKGMILLSVTLA